MVEPFHFTQRSPLLSKRSAPINSSAWCFKYQNVTSEVLHLMKLLLFFFLLLHLNHIFGSFHFDHSHFHLPRFLLLLEIYFVCSVDEQ